MIHTPPRTVRNLTGLNLAIDLQWVDASGYRDVRIHVSTANGAPSPGDRELLIELAPTGSGNEEKFTVEQYVTLAQGDISTTSHMLVPQNLPWHWVEVTVYDGGRRSRQLSSRTSINNNVAGDWSEAVPAILVVDAAAPPLLERADTLTRFNRDFTKFPNRNFELLDVRALAALVQRSAFVDEGVERQRDMDILRRVASAPRLELIPPSDLPQRWIGLTCFDLIVVKQAVLTKMQRESPQRFQAIVDWASTGGNLVVFGLGTQYEKLNDTESLLKLHPTTSGEDYATAGWQPAETRLFNNGPVRRFQELQNYGGWYGYATTDEGEEPQPVVTADIRKAFVTDHQHQFMHRPLGMGTVLAMSSENPFPGSTTDWSWVLNTITDNRAMWYRRHGLSLRRKNNDYWNFLVPDTGRAPVLAFCVLITLFAVIIGPINYFFLARERRLYMLLATIPLGALLVTLSLFAYAMVTDGLGTKVRVRSYTHIDQRSGRVVNWSRQSYYAGLAPSRGLTFGDDTAVYTVEQFPHHEEDYRSRRRRVLEWGDDFQNLQKGYMTSRVTSQFLTVRTGDSSSSLQLDQRAAPTSGRNRLGGKIELLLLRDAAGDYFTASEVAEDEKANLKPADFAEIKGDIFAVIVDARPENPEGLNPNEFERYMNYGWNAWNLIDSGLADSRVATSLMEDRIRRVQNMAEKDFAKGSYVAIVTQSGDAPLGVKSTEEGSLHLVEGKF